MKGLLNPKIKAPKATVKKLKDCRVRMTVEVDREIVEARFQDVFREFQKAARLPGFRDGKAPVDLVEKKYAREAQEEVLKSLIPETYHQSVALQKLSPVTMPRISEIQMERGGKLAFSAEFDLEPEFSLKNVKGIKLKRDASETPETEVEKGLASLLESRAELIPIVEPRSVKPGDFVVTDIEVWQENESCYIPGKKGVLLHVDQGEGGDDFFEKIVGATLDEVREISQEMSPAEKEKGLVGRKPHYKVWLRAIKEKKLPVLDEEFAKSFGKTTVEELREEVRKDISAHRRSEAHEKMKNELFEKLLAMASFSVPEELVEKQKERLIEQARKQYLRAGLPESRFNQERVTFEGEAAKKAVEQVRLYFILKKISAQEDIEVDEAEILQRLQAIALESKRPIEEVRSVFEEDLRESMTETKAIDFLIANAKFEENKAS